MSWWNMVGKIKQLSTLRVTAWAVAKLLFGTGLGLLLATYFQASVSAFTWQVSGWALIIVSVVMGLMAICPIFKLPTE